MEVNTARGVYMYIMIPVYLVRDSSDGFLFDMLELCDVRALSIRKTGDLPLHLWVGTFPRFVAIRFNFISETLI
jgi:hypothetical protein